MNYFRMNKYQSIHENVPYIASEIYKILFKSKALEELVNEYYRINKLRKSLNVENNIKLAIIFLYSIGKVDYNGNIIKRVE